MPYFKQYNLLLYFNSDDMGKPKVIKDYEKLDQTLQEQIKLKYPYGFEDNLVKYIDREGNERLALPFETDDYGYLIRMTQKEARRIVELDDDYDDDGYLKEDVLDDLKDTYLNEEEDEMEEAEEIADENDEDDEEE